MLATAGMRDTEHLHCLPSGCRHMIDLRFILLLQYILCFSLNFDGSITQTDHSDKVGTSAPAGRWPTACIPELTSEWTIRKKRGLKGLTKLFICL